jgi:hypothetical protein
MTRLILSLLGSLAINYALIVGAALTQMLSGKEIYGDKSAGSFACHNGHTDLFYCSGTDFFIAVPFGFIGLLALGTFCMTIILPWAVLYFLFKRIPVR